MDTSTPSPIYLGEDLGMGSNKLYGPHGGIILLSQVASVTSQVVADLLGFRTRRQPDRIRLDGMDLYVGQGAHDWGRPVESMDYDRLVGVPETRAIVYDSLSQYIERDGIWYADRARVKGGADRPTPALQVNGYAEQIRKLVLRDILPAALKSTPERWNELKFQTAVIFTNP